MLPHDDEFGHLSKTARPRGLRRWLQAPVRTGVVRTPQLSALPGLRTLMLRPERTRPSSVMMRAWLPLYWGPVMLKTRWNTSLVACGRTSQLSALLAWQPATITWVSGGRLALARGEEGSADEHGSACPAW